MHIPHDRTVAMSFGRTFLMFRQKPIDLLAKRPHHGDPTNWKVPECSHHDKRVATPCVVWHFVFSTPQRLPFVSWWLCGTGNEHFIHRVSEVGNVAIPPRLLRDGGHTCRYRLRRLLKIRSRYWLVTCHVTKLGIDKWLESGLPCRVSLSSLCCGK